MPGPKQSTTSFSATSGVAPSSATMPRPLRRSRLRRTRPPIPPRSRCQPRRFPRYRTPRSARPGPPVRGRWRPGRCGPRTFARRRGWRHPGQLADVVVVDDAACVDGHTRMCAVGHHRGPAVPYNSQPSTTAVPSSQAATPFWAPSWIRQWQIVARDERPPTQTVAPRCDDRSQSSTVATTSRTHTAENAVPSLPGGGRPDREIADGRVRRAQRRGFGTGGLEDDVVARPSPSIWIARSTTTGVRYLPGGLGCDRRPRRPRPRGRSRGRRRRLVRRRSAPALVRGEREIGWRARGSGCRSG